MMMYRYKKCMAIIGFALLAITGESICASLNLSQALDQLAKTIGILKTYADSLGSVSTDNNKVQKLIELQGAKDNAGNPADFSVLQQNIDDASKIITQSIKNIPADAQQTVADLLTALPLLSTALRPLELDQSRISQLKQDPSRGVALLTPIKSFVDFSPNFRKQLSNQLIIFLELCHRIA